MSRDMSRDRVTGTVYGTLLNLRSALAALGEAVHVPPYGAPPNAPVLYLKPRNTLAGPGAPLLVPPGEDGIRIDATIGLLIGRDARKVSPEDALQHVAGYAIVCDATLPHSSYYRPAIRHRCRDGYCPIGPIAVARDIPDPAALSVRVLVDGDPRSTFSLAELIRPVPRLIADVSAFLTLSAGDMLLVGAAADAPLVQPGERARIEVDGIGILENPVVADGDRP